MLDKGWELSDKGNSLGDMIYNTIRDAVLSGRIRPGERVKELELAESLGVSRTPIREAINRLAEEGLLECKRGCGARVATMKKEDTEHVAKLLKVRGALEGLAVQLITSGDDSFSLGHLRICNDRLRIAANHGNMQEVLELDIQFHNELCELSDNEVLAEAVRELLNKGQRYFVERLQDRQDGAVIAADHVAIIDALARRDVSAAVEAVRCHIADDEKIISQIV